jgi:alkanesulfonate monooxygenase SsuD/methylene tetrahydromethanopterin reductase-like flavin-dependent oxidoreductase (luciferase family)
MIFTYTPSLDVGRKEYAELKALCASTGRDPNGMLIGALVHPVVAETKMEAEDKRAALDKLPLEVDSLMLLSEALNFDFGSKPLDEPLTDEDIASMSGLQAIRDRVLKNAGTKNPTIRDFIRVSGRGRLNNPWVGGPKEVADMFEAYFTAPACDGFVVGATCVPGTYEDFVRFVVPELQRRGLFHKDYRGATLRENLGLARPEIGAWRSIKRGAA